MTTYEEGTWLWKPDDEHVTLPAKVLSSFRTGSVGKVLTEDGEGEWFFYFMVVCQASKIPMSLSELNIIIIKMFMPIAKHQILLLLSLLLPLPLPCPPHTPHTIPIPPTPQSTPSTPNYPKP